MKNCFYLILICSIISCNQDKIYSEFHNDFKKNRWNNSDVQDFDFTIEEEANYDVQLEFSHVYDYQFSHVPLSIEIVFPNGKKIQEEINLQIKDELGKHLADCSGDICDLYKVIKKNILFEKGNYKIKLSNSFANKYLPNVIGVGITIKKND